MKLNGSENFVQREETKKIPQFLIVKREWADGGCEGEGAVVEGGFWLVGVGKFNLKSAIILYHQSAEHTQPQVNQILSGLPPLLIQKVSGPY